jgi:broad-specificity NMP kinase
MEHKRRIENRETEVENLKLPVWEEIAEREYEPWEEEHIVIDTANKSVKKCANELMEKICNHDKKRQSENS